MPDPKLRAAMEEIKPILKKYDCGAMVTLVSEGHTEYLYEISPSWSCAWLEPAPDGGFAIRIKSKIEDYPNKDVQNKVLALTAGMFLSFANHAERQQEQIAHLLAMLVPHIGDLSHWEKRE